jgi:lipopolysaccharide export system protein LptA
MKTRPTMKPVKLASRVLLAALAFLLGILGWRFAARRAAPPAAGPGSPGLAAERVDRKENVDYREFRDGRLQARVRADRFYRGADGLNHLEGHVEILETPPPDPRGPGGPGPVGGANEIRADRVTYDLDMVHFTIAGRARVKTREVEFESDSFDYDKRAGLFRSGRGGTFSSSRMTGSARDVVFDEGREEIRLTGGFRVDIKPGEGRTGAVGLSGDSFVFKRGSREGVIEGRAAASLPGAGASAERLAFAMTEDGAAFLFAAFSGAAGCSMPGDRGRAGAGRAVGADDIRLMFFPGTSNISTIEAAGHCLTATDTPPETPGRLESREIRLSFGPDGALTGFAASGEASMTIEGGGEGARTLQGDRITYDGGSGVLTSEAGPNRQAVLDAPGSKLEARVINLEPRPGNVRASGAVTGLLKPRASGQAQGFFASEEPVFLIAGSVVFEGGPRRYALSRSVRIWQGPTAIRADDVEVLEGTGELRAGGSVATAHALAGGKGEAERRVTIEADRMTSDPVRGTMTYRGRASLRTPEARLAAGQVVLRFGTGRREIERIEALEDVVAVRGQAEGRGRRAFYEPKAEILTLTEGCSLVEKDKGVSRGDKLTFHLADGRILIENTGRGRSTTFVKSQL